MDSIYAGWEERQVSDEVGDREWRKCDHSNDRGCDPNDKGEMGNGGFHGKYDKVEYAEVTIDVIEVVAIVLEEVMRRRRIESLLCPYWGGRDCYHNTLFLPL